MPFALILEAHVLPEAMCVSSTVAVQQWGWVVGGLEFGGLLEMGEVAQH